MKRSEESNQYCQGMGKGGLQLKWSAQGQPHWEWKHHCLKKKVFSHNNVPYFIRDKEELKTSFQKARVKHTSYMELGHGETSCSLAVTWGIGHISSGPGDLTDPQWNGRKSRQPSEAGNNNQSRQVDFPHQKGLSPTQLVMDIMDEWTGIKDILGSLCLNFSKTPWGE